ncbi:hypothetical protein [Thalassotalea profundi]|uniref:Uncharacterized protein n=1 Tax=Thalassotalea profundi TaxID=2036687 RepID=A0ABQ3IUT6_9GAMM|nr:hypothetical protein [Thalassotalea profundi]GHE94138.1 hypothetical protein GCM10011501_24590 [Thalassotalea profundi]
MSPEQLVKLNKLSQLFEEGVAGAEQIKELSELLSEINHLHEDPLLNSISPTR